MSELSDWVWLAVAGIWLVTRLLPRLFRSDERRRIEGPSDAAPPASGGPAVRPEPLAPTDAGLRRPIDPR